MKDNGNMGGVNDTIGILKTWKFNSYYITITMIFFKASQACVSFKGSNNPYQISSYSTNILSIKQIVNRFAYKSM